MNYRSIVVPDPVTPDNAFAMRGYQCDLDGVVIDDDAPNRPAEGLLGVQVHVGPPMRVEYRNLRLKQW